MWGYYVAAAAETMSGMWIAVVILALCTLLFLGVGIFLGFRLRKVSGEKERYDLIAAQGAKIWVDYQFSPQHLVVTGDIGDFTGFAALDMMGVEVYDIYHWVNEETTPIRSILRNFFDSGELYFQKDIQIKKLDDAYAWYSLTGTLVKNEKTKKNKRFVVCLEDIDSQMTQEKELTQAAENDLLTGIYNKKTMENRITVWLDSRISSMYYVFFMIDLDNFKAVNDTLGHIYGDKVLTEAAEKLRKAFPANALIGRLGGDEFAVFAEFEAFDTENLVEYMCQKGEQLCASLRQDYASDGQHVQVSASIGIASAPTDGEDFLTIYQKADKALYLSKRSGKDRYNLFQHSAADE